MGLGQEVKRLRKDRGVTQGQLAKLLRTSRALVALLETDDNNLSESRPGSALLSRIRHWTSKGGTLKEKAPRGPYERGK